MVVSARMFRLTDNISLARLFTVINNASFEDVIANPENEEEVILNTVINGIENDRKNNVVRGTMSVDKDMKIVDRNGNLRFFITREELLFSFIHFANNLYFVPFIRMKMAENIARKIGRHLLPHNDEPILTCRITPANIRSLLKNNPHHVLYY